MKYLLAALLVVFCAEGATASDGLALNALCTMAPDTVGEAACAAYAEGVIDGMFSSARFCPPETE